MGLIEDLRAKVLRNEAVTLDETKAILSSIRRGYKAATVAKPPRTAAAKAAAKPGAKGKTSTMSVEDIDKLFDDL